MLVCREVLLKNQTFYIENCQSTSLVTTYQYRGLPGSPSGLRKVFSSPVKRSLIKDNDQELGTNRKIRVKNGKRLNLFPFVAVYLLRCVHILNK